MRGHPRALHHGVELARASLIRAAAERANDICRDNVLAIAYQQLAPAGRLRWRKIIEAAAWAVD